MKKNEFSQAAEDYRKIEQAIKFIEKNHLEKLSLDDIASAVHTSKFHFQRLFHRWAGITPMQFLHSLTLEYAKQRLAESASLLDATYDAGLSGPGRLHDLFVTFDAITPGVYKKQGEGLEIAYGIHPTPFGECLLAKTDRGICHLSFVDSGKRAAFLRPLKSEWPKAELAEDKKATAELVRRIFANHRADSSKPFHLFLKGTNFQVKVWQALLAIPSGGLASYQDIAQSIGRPEAYRAVANAVANNPIAFLIPCHRVIKKTGEIHNYHWGPARKKAILSWESPAAISSQALAK